MTNTNSEEEYDTKVEFWGSKIANDVLERARPNCTATKRDDNNAGTSAIPILKN